MNDNLACSAVNIGVRGGRWAQDFSVEVPRSHRNSRIAPPTVSIATDRLAKSHSNDLCWGVRIIFSIVRRMSMDPLSDVLSLLKVRSYISGGFDAAGDWSVEFGPHDGIKFHAVVAGECWVSVGGLSDPVRVKAGDCYLLPRGRTVRIASDLSLPPIDGHTLLQSARDGSIVTYNGGGDFFSIGGYFALAGDYAEVLLGVLPPIVHIRKEAD